MQNKRRLFILGAGGFGREIESWIMDIPKSLVDWELVGFLDDNLDALNTYPSDFKVEGRISSFDFNNDDLVIMGIADVEIKEKIFNQIGNKVEFLTFISPKATVGKFVTFGKGTVVCPYALISTNVKVGDLVTVNNGSLIGHDSDIGNYVSLMANVDIGGECIINDKVYFGTNSTLLPRKRICENTLIGAGAIVVRNISRVGTYVGNPAKRL